VSHHKLALITICAAVILDAICGVLYGHFEHAGTWMGLYCAEGNAVTEGACTQPASAAGHIINAIEFITVVPLVAATFSFFTSGLASIHVRAAETRIKQHVIDSLRHAPRLQQDGTAAPTEHDPVASHRVTGASRGSITPF
jgi:hypothetical protein